MITYHDALIDCNFDTLENKTKNYHCCKKYLLQDKIHIFTNDFTTFPHVRTYFQIEARCPSTSKLQIEAPIGAYHQNLAFILCWQLDLGGAKDLLGWVGSDVVHQKNEKKRKKKTPNYCKVEKNLKYKT
jgi:hypothetical protein